MTRHLRLPGNLPIGTGRLLLGAPKLPLLLAEEAQVHQPLLTGHALQSPDYLGGLHWI